MNHLQNFGIIGGGAWGTSLAQALLRSGRKVTLWARNAELVQHINMRHENLAHLPKITLDPRLHATTQLSDLLPCDVWLLAVPTQQLRAVCQQLAALHPAKSVALVICAKGIEQQTYALPSVVLSEILTDHSMAVLSGPSFAVEVAQDQPSALTLAADDALIGKDLTQAMSNRTFRLYQSDDMIGVQIGGALKNVLALACGILTGRQLGDNTKAALVTRGLAEMMRLGQALGARPETLMGLSGLGDLVLSCGSTQSRNLSLGIALGQGKKLAEVMSHRHGVVEGVYTAAAAVALAKKLQIEMPITEAVDAVINHQASIAETIAALLSRPLREERG